MKKAYLVTFVTSLLVVLIFWCVAREKLMNTETKTIKIGVVYVGDSSNAYTGNFLRAVHAIENEYGSLVEIDPKYNISEGSERAALEELVKDRCDLIFATSFGYAETVKDIAQMHPEIQFCMATGTNANEAPYLSNYHTYMGEIYQGRYVSGVVAGMKLRELIDSGAITKDRALIGYVGAYPYAEVISGYTAFLLGVRSEVPEAKMYVKYTYSWGNYTLEKQYASDFIDMGCVIISQHSDTTGPAVACEERDIGTQVYHVGYNLSMADVAPTTSLVSSRINWAPYMMAAVEACLKDERIEDHVKGHINGNDVGAGFERDWVQMMAINENIAAPGTKEKVDELIEGFKDGKVDVFRGDYRGKDPFDPTDTVDLRVGYQENATSSAPQFHYVLDNCVIILED